MPMKLIEQIDGAFPSVAMPPRGELLDPALAESDEGEALSLDLEAYRRLPISAELLRQVHQELRKLSPVATRWLLPFQLKLCLSEDAKYSRFEVEFFVYSLAPSNTWEEAQILTRLSNLNAQQIKCIDQVFTWLAQDEYWSKQFPDQLHLSLEFLKKILARRDTSP